MWTWLYDEKRVISASRPPRSRVIQPWMSNNQTLPTPNVRRSLNNTGVPAALTSAGLSAAASNAELPPDPRAAAAWEYPWPLHRQQHTAASGAARLAAIQATLRSFAGNGLRHQPSTSAAGGAPEAEAQGGGGRATGAADQSEKPAGLTPSLRPAALGDNSSSVKRLSPQPSTSPAARDASGPRREPPAMAAFTPSWL